MREDVKKYYGEELQSSDDLKTNACCTDAQLPPHIKRALSNVHDEVLSRYYGCGLIAPTSLEGCSILDLGSGSGRDAYVLAQLVGQTGRIVGVDMTPEQLDVARSHEEWHRERFEYEKSNVRFLQGELERLGELPLKAASFDVIVSNCVINLCTDKEAVLRSAKALLKSGGEIYFSDVYCDRRIPEELRQDPVLYGECLSGALYINDFEALAKKVGFGDPRIVESRRLTIENAEIEQRLEGYKFYSVTYRLFNIDDLEPNCEDYGQKVTYKGSISESPAEFILDGHHKMRAGEPFALCGNSWKMLAESRFAEHFTFEGDFSTHLGAFAGCGGSLPELEESGGCCASEATDCCAPAKNETNIAEVEIPTARLTTGELKELWIHTGTNCNLSCDGCLEGAQPGDSRIERPSFSEVKRLVDEAVELGVKQLSLTGGEPFVHPAIIEILEYALEFIDVMILTNGTIPLQNQIMDIARLKNKPFALSFRVSLDSHVEESHDAKRGDGNFRRAIKGINLLQELEFSVSVARHAAPKEQEEAALAAYKEMLEEKGIGADTHIVTFPELLPPGSHPDGRPSITDSCMEKYGDEVPFMCTFSRMAVKKDGAIELLPCTLVDDDPAYHMGSSISESLNQDFPLSHHRCLSCYVSGASCSEL